MSKYIKVDSIREDIALYLAQNAYLNETALDAYRNVEKWINERSGIEMVRCDECEHFTRKNLPTDFSKGRCRLSGGYVYPDNLCRYGIKEETSAEVHCEDCKYREWADHFAECGKGYKGIVHPDDTCGKGVHK